MGYTVNHLDGETEFDLDFVGRRVKYIKAVYMNRRSAKSGLIQLRAWFPGPEKTHQYSFEFTREGKQIEKTRVQREVWEAMTKGQKTDYMGNGVEFFTILKFVPISQMK